MAPFDSDPTFTAAEALRLAASALERTRTPAPLDPTLPRWLRAREVAAILGLSVKHVYALMSRQVLPTVRLDRAVRVPEDELRLYMERVRGERGMPMPPAVPVRQRQRTGHRRRSS